MNAIVKIVIGALVMIASVWWVLQGSSLVKLGALYPRSGLVDLVALLNAGVPIIAFLIGLFVVWLELDELRIERELRQEEKKRKK